MALAPYMAQNGVLLSVRITRISEVGEWTSRLKSRDPQEERESPQRELLGRRPWEDREKGTVKIDTLRDLWQISQIAQRSFQVML